MNTVDNLRYCGKLPTPASSVYPHGPFPIGTYVTVMPMRSDRAKLEHILACKWFCGTIVGIHQQVAAYAIRIQYGFIEQFVPADEVCIFQSDYQI